MISSAIWDKSARVNFSKTNKIARARRLAYENPRLVAFSGFVKPLLCCPNFQFLVLWFIYLLFPLIRLNFA